MKNTLIILTLGLTIFGCGKNQMPSNEVSLVASKIVGGTEVVTPTALSQRTVGLFNKKKNSICTGAIIGSDLILTAAHCVFQAAASDIIISFGPKINDSKYPLYVAHKIIVHDGYKTASETVDDDIALIRLKKEIPSTHAILDLEDSRQLTLKKDDLVTSLGFGVTKTGFFTNGTGRGTLRMTAIPLMTYHVLGQKIYLDQRQGSGICYGDSGGPTFTVVNNKPVLVGIASHVSMDEKTKRRNECHMVSALSNPNYFYGWIEDAKLKI